MSDVQVQDQKVDMTPYPFRVEDVVVEERVPRLENGDRLARAEFERRYNAMPNLKKAELIKGVVYIPSPVRHKKHSQPNTDVVGWLAVYRASTPGVDAGVNGTVRLDEENDPQPDAMLRLPAEFGGQSRIDEDDYIAGPPELIIEIAASSVSFDLHDKKDVYGQLGVREYVVWRTEDREIDWFRLENGQYVKVAPDEEGIIESHVFPGLRLATTAMLAGDLARVLAELRKGLDSDEHKAFIQKLAAAG
ncbi:MAG: Uma2 family endonuclease [Blastocatellia bacterium]